MEQFTLSLVYDVGSGGDVIVKEDKVDIWINDTDEALVQLEREHYSLIEGEECEICAISLVAVETEICIRFKIRRIKVKISITFPQPSCAIFRVQDNNILENPSTRPITLESDDSRISIIRNGSITIRDNPSFEATVGLDNMTYTVKEDYLQLNVCVVVFSPTTACPIAFPFELILAANPGTAFQGRDYTLNDRALNFGECSKKECLTVDIIDDDLIEDTETFTITLQPPSQDFTERIILSPNVTTVTIEDEDMAIVTFDRTEYIVQETSGSLTVCASVISPRVSCPVTIPFSLTLLISDNTALNGSDYVTYRVQTIEFARCRRSACAPRRISFVNDPYNVQVENVEFFTLSLLSDVPLVKPDPSTVVVTIRDDSERACIRLEKTTFTVTEGVNETVRICAEIYDPTPDRSSCPVVFDFEINLSVDGEDFPMAFGPCSHRACVSVPIDDDEQLELTKTYTYRLERTDELDRRIDINTTSGTLTVIDDPTDEAVLKLEQPAYSVHEESRSVTVCVEVCRPVIDTPIDFSFSVLLNTIDGTAVSTPRGDFRADFSALQRRPLYFSVRETRECYNIPITNDDTQEDTETFTVTVNRTSSLDPRIRLEDNVAVVSIIDADIATVEFESTAYSVRENAGQVLVCVAITSRHSYCPVGL
ncbi:FRAS1-related extracellular matrix protein 2 [Geodia barretti]|nr:FRAS1-related extracellular matrix protein 2 [Geodia barretti]